MYKNEVALLLLLVSATISAGEKNTQSKTDEDPCAARQSNFDMRDCYHKEQITINSQTDSLAAQIVSGFRKDARDPMYQGVIADSLKQAANAVAKSQLTWKQYRDQYCKAVMYSWTTGSGAGTAYEACMFNLGQTRVQELRSDFMAGRAK